MKLTNKSFSGNLNKNEISDNRKCLQTVKVFFTEKFKTSSNLIFTGKIKTHKYNKKIFNTFNEYFTNITKGLNLAESKGNINFKNEKTCKG